MAAPQDVYEFSDLKNWNSATKDLDIPARLSVFGDPVAHSLSPQMHNPALAAAEIESQYVRLHIEKDDLSSALQLLKEADFIGTNVTIPHKGGVFAAVDEMTEVARRTGSVNTVLVDGDQLVGHNTDAPGLKRAIREEFSVDLSDMRVLVVGAGGGAGRAASVQCALDQCERLVLANRTFEKAQALRQELLKDFSDSDRLEGPADRLVAIPTDSRELERELDHIDLIINSTNLGMKPSDPEVIPQRLIQPHHLVYDMVYSPSRTKLITAARAQGAKAANGLSMLLWQGALAFEFWFNKDAPIEAMRKGLLEGLQK